MASVGASGVTRIPQAVLLPVDFSDYLLGGQLQVNAWLGEAAAQALVPVSAARCGCTFGGPTTLSLSTGELVGVDYTVTNTSDNACNFNLTATQLRGPTPDLTVTLPTHGGKDATGRVASGASKAIYVVTEVRSPATLPHDFLGLVRLEAASEDNDASCKIEVYYCLAPSREETVHAGVVVPLGNTTPANSAFEVFLQPDANWDAAGPDVPVLRETLSELRSSTGQNCRAFEPEDPLFCTNHTGNVMSTPLNARFYEDRIGLGFESVNDILELMYTNDESHCDCQVHQQMEFLCRFPDSDEAMPFLYQENTLEKWVWLEGATPTDLGTGVLSNVRDGVPAPSDPFSTFDYAGWPP